MNPSIFGSMRLFVKARPPVVVFTLSLIAILMSLFVVAFYIKHTDLLKDSHAHEDWNSFVQLLSHQKLCMNVSDSKLSSDTILSSVQPSPASSRLKKPFETFIPMKIYNLSVNSVLRQKLQEMEKPINFIGHINVKGWKSSCQHHQSSFLNQYDSASVLAFTLQLPPEIFAKSEIEVPSCVFLSGLPNYLPFKKSLPKKQCEDLNASKDSVGNVSTRTALQQSKAPPVCGPEGILVELSYDLEDFFPKKYLTNDEKLQIFSNLLMVCYILLGVIFVLLLIAVIQGRRIPTSGQHVLLVDKEQDCLN